MVLSEPAGRTGLVELKLVFDQVAQAREHVMLQRVFRCLQGLGGVGADVLRGGDPVSLQHQFPEGAGVLVVIG
ncbi:hypothetical protein D3C81_1812140 [compost metagenome]